MRKKKTKRKTQQDEVKEYLGRHMEKFKTIDDETGVDEILETFHPKPHGYPDDFDPTEWSGL